MKVLNLYAWIGGNRKLWKDCEVTAVEYNQDIANIYKDFFPDDEVIVWDAHDYLLKHYKEYDFIWSSPPCPTHSDIRRCWVHAWQYDAKYPDMKLYEEIILLKHFAPKDTKRVIENVKPYYNLLIYWKQIERHIFWSNFNIPTIKIDDKRKHNSITWNSIIYGFDLSKYKTKNKRQVLRNCVLPELWLYIYDLTKIVWLKKN